MTADTCAVKDASRRSPPVMRGRIMCLVSPSGPWRRFLLGRRVMADVAFVLLAIGGFAVLVLTMRGLQRL